MSRIKVADELIPSKINTPLDARTRIATMADVRNIDLPYVGMTFYCVETGKDYRVLSLANKLEGAVLVADAAIGMYKEVSTGAYAVSISSLAAVNEIENPFIGQIFYASAERQSYIVLSLKQVISGSEIVVKVKNYTAVSGGIPEAPNDGYIYARKSGSWYKVAITDETDDVNALQTAVDAAISSTILPRLSVVDGSLCLDGNPIASGGTSADDGDDEPVESEVTMYYGYINDGVTYRVSDVASVSGLTSATAGKIGKTSIGVVPAGAVIVVLVPSSSALVAKKDDGTGTACAFSTSNGASGTGANGATLTIGNQTFRAYGEFQMTDSEKFIYVE